MKEYPTKHNETTAKTSFPWSKIINSQRCLSAARFQRLLLMRAALCKDDCPLSLTCNKNKTMHKFPFNNLKKKE